MSTEGGTKAVVAALLANTGIAVMKFLAFFLTGASSMLAEGIHSVADSGNQGLLLLGGKRSERRATAEHPFGFGRERYIYSFLVAIVLFSVGGLFALYEAYHKAIEVHEGKPNELLEGRWWWVAVVVLLGAIVMEGLSFRTAIRESREDPRVGVLGGVHPPREVARAAGDPARGLRRADRARARAARRRAVQAHRQRLLRRRRYGGHRAAAGGGGDRARHRDQEPAARRGGQPGRPAAAARRASSRPTAWSG